MVTATFTYPEYNSRWFKYLALSLCVNLLIISALHLGKSAHNLLEIPMLKVNLMSLAAPAPVPTPTPVQKIVKQSPIVEQKIITIPKAVTKSTIAKPIVHKQPMEIVKQPVPSALTTSNNIGKETTTVIHEAQYRRQIPPIYPRRAQELGQQGTVTLHAQVLANGHPQTLKIVKSSGHRLLDKAAMAAVKQWEFQPTNVNGTAVTSWVRVPVRFIIQP